MNTFGHRFRLTTFGESHGQLIGGVIDGCTSGFLIDQEALAEEMARRRPGNSVYTSQREEADAVSFVSGLYQGRTTGAPLAFLIANKDARPHDYNAIAQALRPGHADYTYMMKYGHFDPRGGGRSSARETAVRVAAGAIARQFLSPMGIRITAYVSQIGSIALHEPYLDKVDSAAIASIHQSAVRCPDEIIAQQMQEEITRIMSLGDSIGGTVSCIISGVPQGWGSPIYDKLSARLAEAMMGINAARAFELGDGFALAQKRGSEANDSMSVDSHKRVSFSSNHTGGILGGISTGQDIRLRVAFKPTSTIAISQETITPTKDPTRLEAHGRHDPCVAIRATSVVEAMAALTLYDAYLGA